MSFKNSLKWSFLSEIASKLIQPLVFIVLARLLTPEDYGVMAAATMVIAFSQIFWEAGMGKALIQRQTDIQAAANVAFFINIVLGLAIAFLLYFFAKSIAFFFFQDERVTAVLQVMVIQVLLGSLGSVQTALLQKEMGFKKLFWVRLSTVALPGLASIPLAWYGWGYWALVAGTLVGQVIQVIMLWYISSWRPSWQLERTVSAEMAKFGVWVGATGLLAWFYVWVDSLIVGHYLGSQDLGLFRLGSQVPLMVFGMIFAPVMPVLYSHLSRVGPNREKMSELAELIVKLLTVIAIPLAVILFMFAQHLESLIFGPAWQGAGVVIGFMALMHGYSWLVGMNGEFYRALGKPGYETIITATTLGVYLLVYLIVVQIGLDAFVFARFLLALGALLLHLVLLRKLLKINLVKIILNTTYVTLLSVSIVWLCQASLDFSSEQQWVQLIFGTILAGGALLAALYLIERKRLVSTVLLIMKK